MERDNRRDQGQWKGCHTFHDIVCDGDQGMHTKRQGGLKMGQTYYYYYEVDGLTETYDPSLPTTTACPFLPGQTVNRIDMPMECQARLRSASTNCLRADDFKTMNPRDKFTTPKPVASTILDSNRARVGSSPQLRLKRSRSSRSLSPASVWAGAARRLRGLRPSSRGSDKTCHQVEFVERDEARSVPSSQWESAEETSGNTSRETSRATSPSEGSRSRDISPESLRRFLLEDGPTSDANQKIIIPEQIIEEADELDDDENFATSAVSENSFVTQLAPPPSRRCNCDRVNSSMDHSNVTSKSIINRERVQPSSSTTSHPCVSAFKLDLPQLDISDSLKPESGWAHSMDTPDFGQDDSNDEDDFPTPNEPSCFALKSPNSQGNSHMPFSGYQLPDEQIEIRKSLDQGYVNGKTLDSATTLIRRNSAARMGQPSFLTLPAMNIGSDSFASDVNWATELIRSRND